MDEIDQLLNELDDMMADINEEPKKTKKTPKATKKPKPKKTKVTKEVAKKRKNSMIKKKTQKKSAKTKKSEPIVESPDEVEDAIDGTFYEEEKEVKIEWFDSIKNPLQTTNTPTSLDIAITAMIDESTYEIGVVKPFFKEYDEWDDNDKKLTTHVRMLAEGKHVHGKVGGVEKDWYFYELVKVAKYFGRGKPDIPVDDVEERQINIIFEKKADRKAIKELCDIGILPSMNQLNKHMLGTTAIGEIKKLMTVWSIRCDENARKVACTACNKKFRPNESASVTIFHESKKKGKGLKYQCPLCDTITIERNVY